MNPIDLGAATLPLDANGSARDGPLQPGPLIDEHSASGEQRTTQHLLPPCHERVISDGSESHFESDGVPSLEGSPTTRNALTPRGVLTNDSLGKLEALRGADSGATAATSGAGHSGSGGPDLTFPPIRVTSEEEVAETGNDSGRLVDEVSRPENMRRRTTHQPLEEPCEASHRLDVIRRVGGDGGTEGDGGGGDAPLPTEEDIRKERSLIFKVDNIIRVKSYFLAFHYAWIVGVSVLGAIVIFLLERGHDDPDVHTNYFDALFIMASGVTCTGLFTKNTTQYTIPSVVVWHVGVICGGTVFTSVVPPLLRIATLKLLHKLERNTERMTPLREEHIRKLLVTSSIMTFATLSYWALFHVVGTCVYLVTHFSFYSALMRCIASFNNSGYLQNVPDDFNEQWVNLFNLLLLVPAGSTLFPVYLRLYVRALQQVAVYGLTFYHAKLRGAVPLVPTVGGARGPAVVANSSSSPLEQSAVSIPTHHGDVHNIQEQNSVEGYGSPGVRFLVQRSEPPTTGDFGSSSGSPKGHGDHDFLLERQDTFLQNESMVNSPVDSFGEEGGGDAVAHRSRRWAQRHEIVRGFHFILASRKPVNHHPWLFRPSDTAYIAIAWCLIVAFQTVPYFFQQWEGKNAVLAPQQTGAMKVLLAITQTVCNRFSGIGLFNLSQLSDGQLCTILFALYLPALPIPTERTHRKWKQMFHGGFSRLANSRFWWLFVATFVIVFLEEGPKYDLPKDEEYGWNHGILMRVLFEVLSAYATSGLSLSLPSSPSSLSSSFRWESKLVIILCMFLGRHRSMDLGLDIGLTDLEKQAAVDPEGAKRNRFADFDMASLDTRRQRVRNSPSASLRTTQRRSTLGDSGMSRTH